MAKIKNGVLGAFSGKIGPIIGGMWKTIAYIKAVPKTDSKRTRTAGQIATQEKMRFINNFLAPFHSYINIGLKNEAASRTEISVAFTLNYHEAILGTYPDFSVDYSKFIFSKGVLPMATNMVATLVDDSIQFTWESSNDSKSNFDDQLMIVIYCSELKQADGLIGGVKRSAKKCTFQLNERFRGKAVEVYASIISWDRRRIANNVYLGRLG